MNKPIILIASLLLMFTLSSCGTSDTAASGTESDSVSVTESQSDNNPDDSVSDNVNETEVSGFDVDLTALSSTMVYAEVYNMMYTPDDYLEKTVRMTGTFTVYEGEERNYYSCIIEDATACCSQGIEFVLAGDFAYPEDYPEVGSTITVSGIFDTYYEGESRYAQLINAVLE